MWSDGMKGAATVFRFLSIGMLVACAGLFARFTAAEDSYPPPIAPESAKLPLVQSILQSEKTRVFPIYSAAATEEERAWCKQFLADFEAGSAVTFVEPVARSDRYDDPGFSPWRNRCPDLAMNSSIGLSPLMLYQDHPQLPLHMPDGQPLAGYEYGTKNFKLYVTDIDDNPENGGEIIFYSERAYSYWEAVATVPGLKMALPPVDRDWNDVLPPESVPPMPIYWGSHYKLLWSNACLANGLFDAEDPYDYFSRQPQPSYNGIIRYKDKAYLFSFDRSSADDTMELDLVEVRYKQVKPVCTYR
jgi:hypothetical protein